MKVRNTGAALTDCTLRRILERQGPEAVKSVLQSFGTHGDHLRQHWPDCDDCRRVKWDVYGDRDIPVDPDPLTPELLDLLRECGG